MFQNDETFSMDTQERLVLPNVLDINNIYDNNDLLDITTEINK